MSDDTSSDDTSVDDLRVPVSGVFSMPASEGASQDQCLLTREDMQRELPALVGAPVRVEHGGEVVGTVEKVTIDDEDRMAGTVRLNRDYSGRRAVRACRTGKYKGFSLGIMHQPGADADGKPIIKDKLILHVALAADPEFAEHTKISEVGEDRRELKLARRFVKIAAAKLRREVGEKKQTDQNTMRKPVAQGTTTERQPPIVSVSSKSSAPSTSAMSSAEEIARQIAELQEKQKKIQEEEEKAKKEASEQQEMQTDAPQASSMNQQQQQQHQQPSGGMQQDGAWQQKPPNSFQSPVVFNMHVGGQGQGQTQGSFDPLSQMSEASAAEYQRQKRDAELYERQRAQAPAGRGKKRTVDEEQEDSVSMVPKTDEKDREIARLKALLGESDGKNRRYDADSADLGSEQEEPEGSRASQKTRDLMSSIQNKLAAPSAAADDVDEDADVDDKPQAPAAGGEEEEIDASSLTYEELSKKNTTLKGMAREINDLKTKIRAMKDGTNKQNRKDELATKQRKYEAACTDYVRKNNAWLMRQIALAGQDIDEDMEETMADYATQVGGLKLGDLSSLNNMGRLVTVSHANAQNGLRQTEEALAAARKEFAKERLRLQRDAERQRVAAERAEAQRTVASSDPRAGVRGGKPKPQGRPHSQPAHAPAPNASASDPRAQFMRTTGLSMPLVDYSKPLPAGSKLFEAKSNPRNMNFVKPEDRHRFRAPRSRRGAQRSVDFDVLKELDRTRRTHQLGQADRLTPSDFGGQYTQPPGSVLVDGNPALARLSDRV